MNRPEPGEALLGAAVGLAVFVAWILLDAPWMQIGEPIASFVPVGPQGELLWPLIGQLFDAGDATPWQSDDGNTSPDD